MVKFGYKLMTEEHGPSDLVENAKRAEAAGFDFVSISDHFHPWLESQGHAPFAWSVLGAIAATTTRIGITTGLTCPIIRYHPAIIAQAAATIAVMSGDRFTLAIGGGRSRNRARQPRSTYVSTTSFQRGKVSRVVVSSASTW